MTDRVMTTEQVRNLYRCAYGWRSEDDLDNGETDLSENRAKQAADFDAWLASVQAEAWQEGALWAAVETGTISHADARWLTPGDNPYRETETT